MCIYIYIFYIYIYMFAMHNLLNVLGASCCRNRGHWGRLYHSPWGSSQRFACARQLAPTAPSKTLPESAAPAPARTRRKTCGVDLSTACGGEPICSRSLTYPTRTPTPTPTCPLGGHGEVLPLVPPHASCCNSIPHMKHNRSSIST